MILNNSITSICICVCLYNTNPKYLEECFDSIDYAIKYFKRYYDIPVEVHVMDDGTDDSGTINMFRDIVNSKYKYIKWWRHGYNTTLSIAINDLHQYTPNDALVIYIDSDDVMVFNRILVQYEIFIKYPQWQNITLCATTTCTPNWKMKRNYNILDYYNYTNIHKIDQLIQNNIHHTSIAYKINHIREFNIKYDEQLKCTQDYDFYLQLLQNHLEILLIPDALVFYRDYPDEQKPDSIRNYENEFKIIQNKYNNYALYG